MPVLIRCIRLAIKANVAIFSYMDTQYATVQYVTSAFLGGSWHKSSSAAEAVFADLVVARNSMVSQPKQLLNADLSQARVSNINYNQYKNN